MRSALGPVILAREAGRLGRRWTVHATRLAVASLAAAVLGVVLLAEGTVGADGGAARIGAAAATGLFMLLLAWTAVLVPLQLAHAVLDERSGRSLDLLLLTGRPPALVFFEIVAARAMNVVTLLLAAIPIFSLILTLGGVGPTQVLGAVGSLVGLAVVLGGVALLLSTASRTTALTLILSIVWLIVFGALIPIRWVVILSELGVHSSYGGPVLVPFFLAEQGVASLVDLAGVAVWIVAGVYAAAVAAWRFGRLPSLDRGGSLPRTWPGRRGGWAISGVLLTVGWGLGEGIAAASEAGFSVSLPPVVLLLLYGGVWLVGHDLFLRSLAWLLPRLDAPVERRWNLGPAVLALLGPVVWRELWTAGQGGLARIVWALAGGWLLIAVLMALAADLNLEVVRAWAAFGSWGAAMVAAALVTLSVTEERARRTLPLLVLSRIGPVRMLRGILIGVAAKTGPIMALTLGAWILVGATRRVSVFKPSLDETLAVHLLGSLGLVTWYVLTVLVLLGGTAALAAGIRSIGVARVLPLVLAVGALPALVFVAAILEDVGNRSVAFVLFPWLSPRAAVGLELVVLFGLWGLAAALCLGFGAFGLAHRMRTGERSRH